MSEWFTVVFIAYRHLWLVPRFTTFFRRGSWFILFLLSHSSGGQGSGAEICVGALGLDQVGCNFTNPTKLPKKYTHVAHAEYQPEVKEGLIKDFIFPDPSTLKLAPNAQQKGRPFKMFSKVLMS